MPAALNSLKTRKTLKVGTRSYDYFSLKAAEKSLRKFERDANRHGHRWYRWFNEMPVLLLVAAVVLVVVKPF